MSKRKLLKAYPFLVELDDFSIEIAEIIYRLRPHWLGYTYIDEWQGRRFLSLKIESPVEPERRRIKFSTDNQNRPTLHHFDWFHFHYGINSERPTWMDVIKYMFEFIDGYRKEEYLVAYNLHEDGRVGNGNTFMLQYLDEFRTTKEFRYIASWLGTYDEDLKESI